MKLWLLPSYKPEAPSSQMRVHRVANLLSCKTEIVPFDMPCDRKRALLKNVHPDDFVLVQKWRNDFNKAEHIKDIKCRKIFDMDDICESQDVMDLGNVCDILFMANHHLVDWAQKKFPNKPVHLIPTGIDIPEGLPPYIPQNRPSIVIAKYGVERYIAHVARIPCWQTLNKKYNIILRILGTTEEESKKQAQEQIGQFCKTYKLVPMSSFWKRYGKVISTAVAGIMPLGKNAQGKSGFSVLTMMAAGVPVVASPYGECDFIIDHGRNGFIAKTPDDWQQYCELLIVDRSLRQSMALEATRTIVRVYCMERIVEQIEKCLGVHKS